MTINASCSCGKTFRVKDELAGKKVKCSACGQPFTVPAPSNASPSSVAGPVTSCACGAQFRVTAKIAGKKVRCPKCKTICQMPAMSAAAGAGAAQAVVAEVAAPVDEDFWAGVSPPQPATEEGDNLFPQEPTSPKDDMSSSQASGYVIRQIHKGKTNEEIEEDLIGKGMKPYDAARLLEMLMEGMSGANKARPKNGNSTLVDMVAGGFSVLHGMYALHCILLASQSARAGQFGSSSSHLLGAIASTCILVAGILLLAQRKKWAFVFGLPGSYLYFGIRLVFPVIYGVWINLKYRLSHTSQLIEHTSQRTEQTPQWAETAAEPGMTDVSAFDYFWALNSSFLLIVLFAAIYSVSLIGPVMLIHISRYR